MSKRLNPAMQTRAAKLRCLRTDDVHTQPCLLTLLYPIRQCLHSFLTVRDVTRLMRASHATTAALLSDYGFVDHVFAEPAQHTLAFYARYRMRVLRMCLPANWNEPLVDSSTGLPQLPGSLIALTLGGDGGSRTVAHAVFDDSDSVALAARVEAEQGSDEEDEREFYERIRPVDESSDAAWNVVQYALSSGRFDQPLPPHVLPRSLRFLQFNESYNRPLQVGSIPDTVRFLQFGRDFHQPLQAGHLPASLTHLVFGRDYNQPLLPGVLPACLRRLRLGSGYNQPIQPGSLPAQLQELSFGYEYNQPILPGVIPSSVTHIRLSSCFNQPLQPGSIPEGVTHLNMGEHWNHPLLPGVLPSSLRELANSRHYRQPLLPGSLPSGLEVLAFHYLSNSVHDTPQPGVIPASVTVVSLSRLHTAQPMVAGSIPATVRWLRLPHRLRQGIAPTTRIVRW